MYRKTVYISLCAIVLCCFNGCAHIAGKISMKETRTVTITNATGDLRLNNAVSDLGTALEMNGYTRQTDAAIAPDLLFTLRLDKTVADLSGFSVERNGNEIVLRGSSVESIRFGVYTVIKDALGVVWYFPDNYPYRTSTSGDLKKLMNKSAFTYTAQLPYRIATQVWGESQLWHDRMREVRERDVVVLHNWHRTIPPKDWFESHPEYFALVDGERKPYQLCTTNADVINIYAQKAMDYFAKNPQAQFFSLSPEDNYNFCECDACRALDVREGSLTDRLMVFFNAVAEQVTAVYPDKKLAFYAYLNYIEAPVDIKPHPAIVPVVCHMPWSFCHNHAATDPSCTANARYKRLVEEWAALCSEVYIREYYTHFYWYGLWPVLHSIGPDNEWYRDIGIDGVISESHEHWGLAGWVLYGAGLHIAGETNGWKQIVKQYCADVFPGSQRWMNEYIVTLEELSQKAECRRMDTVLDESTMILLNKLLIKAEHDAKSDREKDMVHVYRQGFENTEYLLEFARGRSDGDLNAMVEALKKVSALVNRIKANNNRYPNAIKTSLVGSVIEKFIEKFSVQQGGIVLGWKEKYPEFNGQMDKPEPISDWDVTPWYPAPEFPLENEGVVAMYSQFLSGEVSALNSVYDPETGVAQWSRVSYPAQFYSLYDVFPQRPDGVRYYRTMINLSEALEGVMMVRVIDGYVLFIDSEEYYFQPENRLNKKTFMDAIPVSLQAGQHEIVLKIESPSALEMDDFTVLLYTSRGTAASTK
ncbi:MAG: DUF4838 domain-containing protein [Candidatus Auribacter fodinae]|uniref:DUF4838 domain-containing protein n=1 Tax=Candidatus Auribacter fodinae TaxID=2093366 RepID=A0A3A4RA92_9BACT|nr:MAG: DUF4838 domain-containing protein [Candidatus Auribacter fodinae]